MTTTQPERDATLDTIRDGLDAYLHEVDPEDVDTDCLAETVLGALERAAATQAPAADTVTVTVAQLEAALRGYLAILDYDLHKNLECGEETGKDTYAEEAADLFDRLRDAAGGEQA